MTTGMKPIQKAHLIGTGPTPSNPYAEHYWAAVDSLLSVRLSPLPIAAWEAVYCFGSRT